MNVLSIIIAQYGDAFHMKSFTDLGMSLHQGGLIFAKEDGMTQVSNMIGAAAYRANSDTFKFLIENIPNKLD